ncbi:winged helix-turn-helix domain-containing protein [Actinomadura vinacea]
MLSIRALRERSRNALLGGWRTRTKERVPASAWTPLLPLCPPSGAFAGFLMPEEGAATWEEGLASVLATPGERIARDLAGLSWKGRPPGWVSALAARDPRMMKTLERALRDYHHAGIAPYWERIQARIDLDRSCRLRVIAEGGVERLLSTLAVDIGWNSGTLKLHYHGHRELRLDGRGMILAPSVFCGRESVVKESADEPPVLFFPASTEFAGPLTVPDGPCDGHPDALAALLGPTRAAALQGVIGGTTTTELARRLGVTLSTASEHAKILREAGLIITGRMGRQVMHSITPLGAALFHNGERPARLNEPHRWPAAGAVRQGELGTASSRSTSGERIGSARRTRPDATSTAKGVLGTR